MCRRDWIGFAGIGVLSLLLNGAVAALNGVPRPMVHDEFSYLLAADTFAHGRLTNRPHPFWTHFESMHVLQQPTYQSKFPPGPGLSLAAGRVLTGHPIGGVWLVSAAACVGVVWMLRAALPLRWAMFGGLLAVLHPLVLRWSQSYWGGSLTMLAGTLVLGGLERVIRRRRPKYALVVGAGAAILCVTRPYEGLLLFILVLLRLAIWLGGQAHPGRLAWRLGWLLVVGVAPGLIGLGYYNFRVTGHAFKLPYVVYMEQYQFAPLFVWQAPTPAPEYRHEAMRAFHSGWEIESWGGRVTLRGFLRKSVEKLAALAYDYTVVGALTPLFIGLVWALRVDRGLGAGAVMLVVFTGALLATNWAMPHYAAPAAGLLFLLLACGARSLWGRRWRGWALGVVVVLTVVALEAAASGVVVRRDAWRRPRWWPVQRARIVDEVTRHAPLNLVFVRYGPRHSPHAEWVYNDADIDHAAVVWARSTTPEDDRRFMAYFRDRRVWRLDVDDAEAVLRAEGDAAGAPPAAALSFDGRRR